MPDTFDPSMFPPRWSEHNARQALSAWRASGLTVRAFARRYGVPAQRLHRWFRRLGAWPPPITRSPRASAAAPSFVELLITEWAPPRRPVRGIMSRA